MPQQPAGIDAHLLIAESPFPNNPDLPLLVYRQALGETGDRAAQELERLFAENGWVGSWRNGVYDYHHYHSNAHEVLSICAGRATIQFGGPSGPILQVEPGDVAILPAGTAHKKVEASSDLLVVGAYPAGQEDYDLVRGEEKKQADAEERIAAVPLPNADPVYGPQGPLFDHWAAR